MENAVLPPVDFGVAKRVESASFKRLYLVIAFSIGLLVLVELAAQLRSQWRLGQSVFNLVASRSMYQVDPVTGLTLLRPSSVFQGSKTVISSNSLGLRSPEIQVQREPGSIRVAVIGASTVMGAYASANETTFPACWSSACGASIPGGVWKSSMPASWVSVWWSSAECCAAGLHLCVRIS